MAKKCSKAVEVIPGSGMEWLVGSTKDSTARICKNGRNVVMAKVKQPNKTGGDPQNLKSAGERWRSMTAAQKQPWHDIAVKKDFRSGWNAFISSFLKSVAIHGLDYTMNHEAVYVYSEHREKRAEQLNNSLKRLSKYQVKQEFYTRTEEMLSLYPVAYSSPLIELRLEDISDVNNALAMKWLYRCDPYHEYQFDALEQDQYTEKGSYSLIKRPRQGVELYQFIQ